MDVPAIMTIVGMTEGEENSASSQESDPAFLQLLAGLTLIQPNTIYATQAATDNGDIPLDAQLPPAEPQALTGISAADATQKNITPVAPAHGAHGMDVPLSQPMPTALQAATADKDCGTSGLMPAEKNQAETTTPDTAPQVASNQKEAPVNGQVLKHDAMPAPAVETMADVQAEVQHPGQAGRVKGESSAPTGSIDRPPHVPGSPVAMSQALGNMPGSSMIQPSVESYTLAKDSSTVAHSLVSGAAVDVSNGSASGREQPFGWTEHDAWKGAFTRSEANGNTPVIGAAAPAFGMQFATAAARSVSASVPIADVPVVVPELPALPSSVRFEVHPGDLGRVRVHVSIVDHTVYTNVMTERPEMQEWLVKGSERLEAGLAAHGLEVGRFQVDVLGQGREHADRGGTAWSHQDSHRQPPQPSRAAVTERHPDERQSDREERMVNLFA